MTPKIIDVSASSEMEEIFECAKQSLQEECLTRTVEQVASPQQFISSVQGVSGHFNRGPDSVNRCTHVVCCHCDENDGEHRPTDQDEQGRHNHTRIRDVCTQARQQVGQQGGGTGDAESKRVHLREQGKTTATTAEELKKVIACDEVYFVHNGRILRNGEVTGLRNNVVVHAVGKMHGRGKKKTKKRQDTESSSLETDAVRNVATKFAEKTDPEMLDKLSETQENWRKIGQEVEVPQKRS